MGIQSTQNMKREHAISRIIKIVTLLKQRDYREIESITQEHDENLANFVDNWKWIDIDNIEKWTNEMLSNYMDKPFFRQSMFDNYIVNDETY